MASAFHGRQGGGAAHFTAGRGGAAHFTAGVRGGGVGGEGHIYTHLNIYLLCAIRSRRARGTRAAAAEASSVERRCCVGSVGSSSGAPARSCGSGGSSIRLRGGGTGTPACGSIGRRGRHARLGETSSRCDRCQEATATSRSPWAALLVERQVVLQRESL